MRTFAYIVLLSCFCSCESGKVEFVTNEELTAYVNDPENGFIRSEETKDFLIEAKLTPALSNDSVKLFTINMRINRLDGRSVLESGNAQRTDVLNREGYLSFEVLKDVYFECDGKIVNPVFHHYERNYGLKQSIDVLFDFPNIEPESDPVLHYRDELFGQGLIRLKFDKELFATCYVKES